MKSFKLIGILCITSGLLIACTTPAPNQRAPIVEMGSNTGSTYPSNITNLAPADANVQNIDPKTQYLVKKGDNLYRIAMEKGQTYSDLVVWNNLTNPNDIKVGQVLRIVPPTNSKSTGSTQNGVDIRPIASNTSGTNNKNSPRADKQPYSDDSLNEMKKNNTDSGKSAATQNEIEWIWPTEGRVITNFTSKNKGIDITGKSGQPVLAAAGGVVMYTGSGISGLGNMVIIKHSNNFLSAYANNKTILVTEKQTIKKGQKIAEMGNSDSDKVKLHFEIRQQGKAVDPLKFLPAK